MTHNTGQRWSEEADHKLKAFVEQGRNVKSIASSLGRTELSITCRMERLGLIPDDMSSRMVKQEPQPKEIPMTVTIEKVTLINGERADQMRPDHILDILRRERTKVTDLRVDLPPGSAYRTEREAEHNENIKVLTGLLDQYHTKKED